MAGTAGGRVLRSPEGTGTRPTADRVREAVFNALHSQGRVEGARLVDLFAGSGAMGIEALSRGAEHVWFVESDRRALTVIAENLATLHLADRATVDGRDVFDALDRPVRCDGSESGPVDLVVCDPPYRFDDWPGLFERCERLLEPGRGLLVAESGASLAVPSGWENRRERTYGGTVITFATRTEPGADA